MLIYFFKLIQILQVVGNDKVVILGDFNFDILRENSKNSKMFFQNNGEF